MKPPSRYIVGIDLGTSSCSLAYFDCQAPQAGLQIFYSEQWVAPGQTDRLPTLPSFCYFVEKHEQKNGTYHLPHYGDDSHFAPYVVGHWARAQGAIVPDRVAFGAKSWLCHPGVDRRSGILPWHSTTILGESRLSPLAASALYLRHLRLGWNHYFADQGDTSTLEKQSIVITLPASFDEQASALTLEAALAAGYNQGNLRLLEEPQAAFYAWQFDTSLGNQRLTRDQPLARAVFDSERISAQLELKPNQEQLLLVCDIGGGTSDFSLLAVNLLDDNSVRIKRVEVSNHILLGGDNFDLHLAHLLESRWQKGATTRLSSRQWARLIADARWLKEKALTPTPDESSDPDYQVGIAGEGKSLVAQSSSVALKRSEILTAILEGFFPRCSNDALPHQSLFGIKEWGLPHPEESAITRHLAAFLKGRPLDGVLFTGGSFVPSGLRQHVYSQLCAWQSQPLRCLENQDYQLAVSRGAAIYGACLTSQQGRIEAGYPRSLFIEVARTAEAGNTGNSKLVSYVGLIPRGFAATEPLPITGLTLQARMGLPVAFTLYSTPQGDYLPGTILTELSADFTELPPLTTSLSLPTGSRKKPGQLVEVHLEVSMSETGLLSIFCVAQEDALFTTKVSSSSSPRWQLLFNVQESGLLGKKPEAANRSAEISAALPESTSQLALVKEYIAGVYGKKDGGTGERIKPRQLGTLIEAGLGADKYLWSLSLLRTLADLLLEGETRRGRSLEHEAAWLSLTGFFLRPGYGLASDPHRLDRLWQAYARGMVFPHEKRVEDQWWILWRRVAGGLDASRQDKLFNKVFPLLRPNQASPEIIRMVGSLERVDVQKKIRLGAILLEQIASGKTKYLEQKLWALTRLANRRLLYGGMGAILPPQVVEEWFATLKQLPPTILPSTLYSGFIVAAGRKIGERTLDISEESRDAFIAELTKRKASSGQIRRVAEYQPADYDSMEQLFGEQLPPGLVLR